MRLIKLTRGQFAIVDDCDFDDLDQFSWRASPLSGTNRGKFRAQRDYLDDFGFRHVERMHSRITGYAMTDHINGNPLDNRRANLRPVTASQNSCNVGKRRGSSIYKGVHRTRSGKWAAKITRDGVTRTLGTFTSETFAAFVYDESARRLHGQYARLNFPAPGEQSALEFA